MSLNGQQQRQIHDALLDAFTWSELDRLAQHRLETNLDHVGGGRNLSDIVTNLVAWADRNHRALDLIDAACTDNPGNLLLQALHADADLALLLSVALSLGSMAALVVARGGRETRPADDARKAGPR